MAILWLLLSELGYSWLPLVCFIGSCVYYNMLSYLFVHTYMWVCLFFPSCCVIWFINLMAKCSLVKSGCLHLLICNLSQAVEHTICYSLYKLHDVMQVLATICEELPPDCVVLVYLSASGLLLLCLFKSSFSHVQLY